MRTATQHWAKEAGNRMALHNSSSFSPTWNVPTTSITQFLFTVQKTELACSTGFSFKIPLFLTIKTRILEKSAVLVCPFEQGSTRELSRPDKTKGESCSLECSSVFVNIINHRLADGSANCTCGNNMTRRILLFTDVNCHFHQASREKERGKNV